MPRFRIKKVESFSKDGKRYFPGDIVELPEKYAALDFTEPVVEEEKKEPKAKK